MKQSCLFTQLAIAGYLMSVLPVTAVNAAGTVASKSGPGDFGTDKTTVFVPAFTKYIDTCKDELGFDEIPAFA